MGKDIIILKGTKSQNDDRLIIEPVAQQKLEIKEGKALSKRLMTVMTKASKSGGGQRVSPLWQGAVSKV